MNDDDGDDDRHISNGVNRPVSQSRHLSGFSSTMVLLLMSLTRPPGRRPRSVSDPASSGCESSATTCYHVTTNTCSASITIEHSHSYKNKHGAPYALSFERFQSSSVGFSSGTRGPFWPNAFRVGHGSIFTDQIQSNPIHKYKVLNQKT